MKSSDVEDNNYDRWMDNDDDNDDDRYTWFRKIIHSLSIYETQDSRVTQSRGLLDMNEVGER